MSESTSNGITLKVPSRLLPKLALTLMAATAGGLGGHYGFQQAVAPAAQAAPMTTNLSDQLAAQATALAVLQTEMRGLRADLRELKDDVKALRSRQR